MRANLLAGVPPRVDAADDVLDLAAAAPTGLAFTLPDGTDEIELGGQSLLGLCEQLELEGRSEIAVSRGRSAT